jgi:tetratricopeptide (TPR) repeat protein
MLKRIGVLLTLCLFSATSLFAEIQNISENPQVKELADQAALARSNHQLDQAVSLYNQAIQLDSNNFLLYRNVGILYFEKNDLLNSAKTLLTANKLKPDDSITLIYTGKVLLKLDDVATAKKYLETALGQGIDSPELYGALGDMHRALGENQQALEAYQKAIELGPDKPEGYTGLGHLYYNNKKYEMAAGQFEEALKYAPESGDLWYNAGMSYLGKDDLNKAAECMYRSLSYQPNNPETFNALGTVFMKANQFELAEKSFQKALELDPAYEPAKKNMEDLKWQERQMEFNQSQWSRAPYETTSRQAGPLTVTTSSTRQDNLAFPFNDYSNYASRRRPGYVARDPFMAKPGSFNDPYSTGSGTATEALMAIGQALLAGVMQRKSEDQ